MKGAGHSALSSGVPLRLTHIAEPLVARLIERNPARFLSRCGLPTGRPAALRIDGAPICEVPFAPFRGRAFDGACRVDILIKLEGGRALACEVKLGHSRLSSTRISQDFLRPCSPSHQGSRWSGTVMSVLERRFQPEPGEPLHVQLPDGGSAVLLQEWALIVRRSVRDAWPASPISTNGRVVAVEDIIDDAGGPTAFNEAVQSLLRPFDFHQEWFPRRDVRTRQRP
jgi:hypothetical protein